MRRGSTGHRVAPVAQIVKLQSNDINQLIMLTLLLEYLGLNWYSMIEYKGYFFPSQKSGKSIQCAAYAVT